MKTERRIVIAALAVVIGGIAGCGPSKEELAAKERARLDAEAQARRDEQRANKAITEMGKKLGRKVPPLDLGLPPQKQNTPAPEPARTP